VSDPAGRRPARRPDPDALVALAGGGTGGHVFAALAVADALVDAGRPRDRVVFVGSRTGQEARLVPEQGYDLVADQLINLRRRPEGLADVPRWIARGVRSVISLAVATAARVRSFGADRPGVVVSVGGYASVPSVVAAWLRRIPIVVVSYDAVPGLASRLTARVAARCAVAFSTSTLPKRIVTGAPVRADVLAVDRHRDRDAARAALGLARETFVVVAVGGSLGAGKINDVMSELATRWATDPGIEVRHIVGARNAEQIRSVGPRHHVVAFEHRMPDCYAAADMVVARAGASTVAEIGAVGIASVLVPWSGAAGDHQTVNARALSNDGGAVLLSDADCSPDRVDAIVQQWRHDRQALAEVAAQATALGRRDGAAAIARLVEECIR
jgi:UDP-N-acetylglucosamine--N-acetylmuramyl-(pentapeptide) pyrophosphoryl-undecaprenol N-acetylglucosamine transferase